jgi:Lrp/AsnC family leucine-responsive transcriptional regulator
VFLTVVSDRTTGWKGATDVPRSSKAHSYQTINRYTVAPSPPAQLDEVDLGILRLLSEDARYSQRRLARELGMSAPAVAERIARLERQGVITGYGVRLNWGAIGYPTTVYITITANLDYEMGAVMRDLMAIPEVEDVQLVTGNVDMILRARVRDHTHLSDLLRSQIWQIEGIERTDTALSVAEVPPKNAAAEVLAAMLATQSATHSASSSGGTQR